MAKVKMSLCPHCGTGLDGASAGQTRRTPEPGDLSVCFYCAGLNYFGEDLTLQKFPEEDIQLLPAKIREILVKYQDVVRRAALQPPLKTPH